MSEDELNLIQQVDRMVQVVVIRNVSKGIEPCEVSEELVVSQFDLMKAVHESNLGDLYTESGQTLLGSFSAVSTPIFGSKYALELGSI